MIDWTVIWGPCVYEMYGKVILIGVDQDRTIQAVAHSLQGTLGQRFPKPYISRSLELFLLGLREQWMECTCAPHIAPVCDLPAARLCRCLRAPLHSPSGSETSGTCCHSSIHLKHLSRDLAASAHRVTLATVCYSPQAPAYTQLRLRARRGARWTSSSARCWEIPNSRVRPRPSDRVRTRSFIWNKL